MEMIFLNAAGTVLFVRDDIESGHWVQQEYNMTADFPYDAGKLIERGQRIAFRNPATDVLEVFEIRVVRNSEPDHYQQITAEHICVAELSDEHIDNTEINSKTAAQALTTALTGTLWSLGNNTASSSQNGDFGRGSVWDAVNYIQQNWNVYITPRVTFSSAGAITGRYLDVAPAVGVWRGLRLSIRKNMLDPVVTYDDEEVLTALYGYGGNIQVPQETGDDETVELTFADVVWSATSDHPAKPSGQTYLEWPEKTALYGRNGRARFGYYQNSGIKDADILLQKTWEALKKTADPKINISGTCVDLYRLGYHDEPIQLHDQVVVEIEETGEVFQKEIICNDVDLVDPTGTRPEIGDYIPNIVYISRDTDDKATGSSSTGRGGGGGGRGGGGNRGLTALEDDEVKTYTEFVKTNDYIGMIIGTRNGNDYIKGGEISLAINESGESGSYETTAYINADHVNISATSDAYALAGELERTADGKLLIKSAGGMYVQRTEGGITSSFGVWDNGNVTAGMIATVVNGYSSTYIKGDKIVIGTLSDEDLNSWASDANNGTGVFAKFLTVETLTAETIQSKIGQIQTLSVNALAVADGVSATNFISANTLEASSSVSVGGTAATWQSETVGTSVSLTSTGSKTFVLSNGTLTANCVTGVTLNTTTIYFLGHT